MIVDGRTVGVANAEEAVVAIPVIVEPIQVQVTLRIVPVEVSHVAVAIDLGHGAMCDAPSSSPPFESEKLKTLKAESYSQPYMLQSMSHQLFSGFCSEFLLTLF